MLCSLRPCCSYWNFATSARILSTLPKPRPPLCTKELQDKNSSTQKNKNADPPFVFFRPKEILYQSGGHDPAKRRIASASGIVEVDEFLTPVPTVAESEEKGQIKIHGMDTEKFLLEESLGLQHSAIKDWEPLLLTKRETLDAYMSLSKIRLTGLVVCTALGGFAMAPGPIVPMTLFTCCIGTGLLSMTANSVNHFLEAPFDAQMKRTQSRPLVTRRLTPLQAMTFASMTGCLGMAVLLATTHPLTAALGAANVLLYTSVYTPMKRSSILCTWAGAVVGAIPPLMGWVACVGAQNLPAASVLAAILFAWQFPHFNGLSWNLRQDYSRAGYRVMCVTNPRLCTLTSFRYSIALLGLCSIAAPLTGLTTWTFAIDTIPFNAYLIYLAYKFHANPDSQSSRKLFRYSLIYLPAVLLFMIVGKDWQQSSKAIRPDTKLDVKAEAA